METGSKHLLLMLWNTSKIFCGVIGITIEEALLGASVKSFPLSPIPGPKSASQNCMGQLLRGIATHPNKHVRIGINSTETHSVQQIFFFKKI
jgi:hypothetical protein